MYLEWFDLVLVLLAGTAIALFLRAQQHRSVAEQAARRQCKKLQLQFLDQSVFLKSQAIKVGAENRPGISWVKHYGFEFSVTGERRYSGVIELYGNHVTNIELEPHVLPVDDLTEQSADLH